MKLFQKIYWMVILGMLILASGMLGYMLWEMQSQNLLDVCRYEEGQIGQSVENIKKKVQYDISAWRKIRQKGQ